MLLEGFILYPFYTPSLNSPTHPAGERHAAGGLHSLPILYTFLELTHPPCRREACCWKASFLTHSIHLP